MKKRVLAVLAFVLIPIALFGEVTATQKVESVVIDNLYVYELAVTANTTGTVQTTYNVNGLVYMVETDPGSPAPTDNYDLTLTNENGIDIMGGALANRDTSNTERAFPLVGTSDAVVPNKGKLTLGVTGNEVANATFKVRIFYMK